MIKPLMTISSSTYCTWVQIRQTINANLNENWLCSNHQDQLKSTEARSQTREVEIKRQNDKYEREIVLLKSELEASQLHIKNFKNQIDEREQELNELRYH